MAKKQKFNILIADNQFLITEALTALIKNTDDYHFCGLVSNANELTKSLALINKVDLLVTDFNLMDFTGFDDLKKLKEKHKQLEILILTNQVRMNEINEYSKAGIRNIIYKTSNADEIFTAIESTLQKKKYYSGEILDLLLDNKTHRDEVIEPGYLTPTEVEIVKLVASGLTTKEIAAKKHVSFHTVMSHRKNIFRKLNINNSSELVMYAIKNGLIDNIEYYI